MGFNMFAWGFRGYKSDGKARKAFHYEKNDCLDQGDFEPPKLLSMIPDSPNVAGVAKKIVGTPESHIGGAEVKGMMKIAELVFAHQVITGINLLRLHANQGSISVYCHQKKWYWADANSFTDFSIIGTNPGRDFLKAIGPDLVKTELNNFGVLGEISLVLSAYDRSLRGRVNPLMLRMEIRH